MQDDSNPFNKAMIRRARRSQTMRVLVVDDDASILQLLQTALVLMENYFVVVADSADKALEMINGTDVPFDCFLLDIQMPETDGIELLKKIRKLEIYSEAPVVMLTAMSERAYIDKAFIAGATDYITKPFDLIDLRGRMNAARRLVQERQKAEQTQRRVVILANELRRQKQFKFDDPLVIGGADKNLRFTEFNNYISQMSRGQFFTSYALAILLQDARSLYDMTDCDYFRHAVKETALCLQSAATKLDFMFSYRGSGLFLAIIHNEQSLRDFPKEEKLNQYIQTILGERRRADVLVQVLLSKPFSMRSLSRSGAEAAINRAISNAQTREVIMQRANWQLMNDDHSGHMATSGEPRRRLYERVLIEIYNEDRHLNIN